MFLFCSLRLTFTRLYTHGVVLGKCRKNPCPIFLGCFMQLCIPFQLRLCSSSQPKRKRSKFHMFLQRGYDRTSVSVILKAILYGSPHLLAPYTHETPTSSKKQINRSGSVPVKLSNICSQYSPDV